MTDDDGEDCPGCGSVITGGKLCPACRHQARKELTEELGDDSADDEYGGDGRNGGRRRR